MSEHHFLDEYLMRDVIKDIRLKDILLRRVKLVIDMERRKRNLIKWYNNNIKEANYESSTQISTDVKSNG